MTRRLLPADLFPRRLPFLPLLGCAVGGITASEVLATPTVVWLTGTVTCGVLFFLTRRTAPFVGFCVFVFALLHAWQSRDSAAARFADWLGSRQPLVTATGVVMTEPRAFADKSRFTLQLEMLTGDGFSLTAPIRLQTEWKAPVPAYGDRVRVTGTLEKPEPPRNPGEFDFAAWSARNGIFTRLVVRHAQDTEILSHHHGNPIVALALRTRNWMRGTLTHGLDDPIVSGLLLGMVLGETSDLPERLQEEFRGTGTFHLFSVSGLHVGILAVLLWQVAKILGLSRRQAACAIIPLLFFYALMTGLKPASTRAAIMASIVLLGLISERRPILLNNLLAAGFLILLWDTNQLFNPGFQLSFCVVSAILLFDPPLRPRLEKPFHPDPFFPDKLLSPWQRRYFQAGQKLASLASVSTAAWLGSLPLTLGYFYLISFSALPANMFAVPLSFAIMAVAMLSLLGGLACMGIAAVFNQTNWLLSHILLGVIGFFAALPGSFVFLRTPIPAPPPVEIVVFDFEAGAAAAVFAGGRSWLIDSGPAFQHDRVLLPFLRSRGLRRLDGLILTHGDAKHIGATASLLESCPPDQVVDTVLDDNSPVRARLHQTLAARGNPKSLHHAGDVLTLAPGVTVQVLFPPPGLSRSLADDKGFVLRLDAGTTRVLFLADAGLATEQWLLEHVPDRLAADILIKGSARSGPSGDVAFLEKIAPRLVVATAADFPSSEKIPPEFAAALEGLGIRLFRQDECGAVTIHIHPHHWEASAFLTNRHYSRLQ